MGRFQYVLGALAWLAPALLHAGDALSDYDFLMSINTQPAPWEFSVELNDTGIEGDGQLREVFSVGKPDLIAPLDYFALDYETDSFDQHHSVAMQYDSAPFVGEWYMALEGFYTHEQLSVDNSTQLLDDVSWGVGLYAMELITLGDWLINWGLGARWQAIETDELRLYENDGSNQFLLPGAKLQWQAEWGAHEISGYLTYEGNVASLADTKAVERPASITVPIGQVSTTFRGRASVGLEQNFQLLSGEYRHRYWLGGAKQRYAEWLLSGQTSWGDLVLPNFQRSVGGLYSVRGYDDQVLSGNEVIATSLSFARQVAGSGVWLQVFYDWAHVTRDAVLVTFDARLDRFDRRYTVPEDRTTLRSIGVAAEFIYNERSCLYLALAQALAKDGVDTESGDIRAHAYLRYYF